MAHQQPKAVLRLLLRVVNKHMTSVAGNQQWKQHVLQQFRQGRAADAAQQQPLQVLAQEYADLVRNIAHHQELLETYNIGVDSDARNRQMVEKTAARVGFKLPGADTTAADTAAEQQDSAAARIPQQGLGQDNAQQQQQQQQLQQQQVGHGAAGASRSSGSTSSSSCSQGSTSSSSGSMSSSQTPASELQQEQQASVAAA